MEQIVFLEGESGTDHRDEFVYLSRYFNCMIFDELYAKPNKLAALKFLNPEYLYVGTTGMRRDELNKLEDLFTAVGWVPKGVIFSSERSVMAVLGLVRELKEKGVKFYYNYRMSGELEEISWI